MYNKESAFFQIPIVQTLYSFNIFLSSFNNYLFFFFALLKISNLKKFSTIVGEMLVHRNLLEKFAILNLLISLFYKYSDIYYYSRPILKNLFCALFACVVNVRKLACWC